MKNTVAEEIQIKATKAKVFSYLKDMKLRPDWSPWTSLDANSKIKYSKEIDGKYHKMEWESAVVGNGNMELVKKEENKLTNVLNILKPFKSNADVFFYIKEEGDTVNVTWEMQGSLPFFMFFHKPMISKMISKDFSRGLKRLKVLVENGSIPAKLEFIDEVYEEKEFNFIGKKNKVLFNELGKKMSKDIDEVMGEIQKTKTKINLGYCFYDKVLFVKDIFEYTAGFV